MLVQFNFKNYRCFKSETTLSLVASDKVEHSSNSIVKFEDYSILKTVVVYGANASGKTKLFQAFSFMGRMICGLAKDNKYDWQSNYEPFALDEKVEDKSSSFEVIFIQKGSQYRYGFELNKDEILAEWLYKKGKSKEIEIFYRDDEDFSYHKTYIKSQLSDTIKSANMLRKDALLLTILPVWNNQLTITIVDWFMSVNVLSATSRSGMAGYSIHCLNDSLMKGKMISMLKSADINIDNLSIREANLDEIPDEIKKMLNTDSIGKGKIIDGINTTHRTFDDNGLSHNSKSFSLETDESYGTYRMFALSAPIIDTLENGKVLFIDEIDNGLHSDLLRAIVSLFQDAEINKNNAQLIINTHDLGLLDTPRIFKNDQIYISQKDRFGEASLTSLLSFDVDSDCSISKLYREGKFGGVPYLLEFMKNVLSSK